MRGFLLIKDSLRRCRFEWIFGVAQLVAKRHHQRRTLDIGVSCVDMINQEAHLWKSGVVKGPGDALLTDMFKAQKTRVEFTIYALLELVSLCIEDEEICEYIYTQPPPTYQYARYPDWFETFAREHRAHQAEQNARFSAYHQDIQSKDNVDALTQILSLLPTFREKCAKFEARWR